MKAVEFLERFTRVVIIIASGAGIIALVTLNAGDSDDLRRFVIYIVTQASLEFVAVALVGFLIWMALRSKGLHRVFTHPRNVFIGSSGGILVRNVLATLLCLGIVVTVSVNAFYLTRARAYFWRFLLQDSYVEGTIGRVDELTAVGRIQDAHNLTVKAQKVLSNEADQAKISNRAFDLASRVEISRRLSERYRRPDPLAWNPITERDYYFGNVEALRLNPQNYQAAQVLTNLHRRILTEMQADVPRLCGQATDLQTVSVLELEVFQWKRKGFGDCENQAGDFLRTMWQPDAVGSLLSQSRHIAQNSR